jgi:hypothetical protein
VKLADYHSMLRSIEAALKSSQTSHGFMDQFHRTICEDVQQERTRLLRLIKGERRAEGVRRQSATIKVD